MLVYSNISFQCAHIYNPLPHGIYTEKWWWVIYPIIDLAENEIWSD